MPPILPRKRLRSHSPTASAPKAKRAGPTRRVAATPRKATLFDDLDATATPGSSTKTTSDFFGGADSDESELSSLSDADFEDVALPGAKGKPGRSGGIERSEDEDEDDGMIFEDVHAPPAAPPPSGDLELTLHTDSRVSLQNVYGNKKGASKADRRLRVALHCVHVQCLLWHNHARNAWCGDETVQGILVSLLPGRLWEEVDRWRMASGLDVKKEEVKESKKAVKVTKAVAAVNGKSRGRGRGKRKSKDNEAEEDGEEEERPSRDWGDAASRLENGVVDMSHGDPLFRLLKSLSAWWKQRFHVTAPGIRKLGYMSLERLDRLIKAYATDAQDSNRFGEHIRTLEEFREAAMKCEGSRDVGAQLFTALLRGLGMEARMVANLQPLGFGWNKSEEADEEKDPKLPSALNAKPMSKNVEEPIPKAVKANGKSNGGRVSQMKVKVDRRGKARVSESDDESEEAQLLAEDSDDDSVVEILRPTPKKTPKKVYDKELEFPHYWTEVLSPATKKYVVVEAVMKGIVGTNRDAIESLEPRGGKADKAKQVMAYVAAYSPDGTAKDVTVRYLKKQLWPGRTKGVRMAVEKVPVYNRHGKVKRHDMFDWFRSAMAGYERGGKKHPVTEVDEQENATDLKPAQPEKKDVKEGEETLQYYKQSKEFVLERHLKREEALLPGAKAVRMFSNKGKGGEVTDEPVYSRSDVVQVKSAETWHKQGRAPLEGETPLKRVPYRAATTNRRRELAAAEAATGEKVLQGLYSFDQTDWIIPPPIENGVIPKNEYGNIDLFAEHMCPEGAVHVPFRSAVRVCKKLEIDFAEAVVGFEFGHRMAIPVISGVVIAEENHDLVMEEVAKEEAERARKEDEKKRKEVLSVWRKLLMGMRIVQRIKEDYGEMNDEAGESIFGPHHGHHAKEEAGGFKNEDMAGGFLPDGFEYEDHDKAPTTSGFFPTVGEEEHEGEGHDEDGDALMVEHGEGSSVATPVSVEVLPKAAAKRKAASKANPTPRTAKGRSTSRKKGRRRAATPSDDEDDSALSDPPSDPGDGDFDM